MRLLQFGFCLFMLLHAARGEERKRIETVAESFDGHFAVLYEQTIDEDTPQPSPQKERLRGQGTAGTKDSVGTVYIADTDTGKRVLTVADFDGGTISARWRPTDDYVIVGWSTERFNWGRKLFQRIRQQKTGETTFREIDLEKLGLTKALSHDPKRIKESVFMVTPAEWERTDLIAEFIPRNRSGTGAHPFGQDEIWYDVRIAIRRDGKFEVVALWRTHESESNSGMELVWEK